MIEKMPFLSVIFDRTLIHIGNNQIFVSLVIIQENIEKNEIIVSDDPHVTIAELRL